MKSTKSCWIKSIRWKNNSSEKVSSCIGNFRPELRVKACTCFIEHVTSEAETEQKNQIVLAELEDDYEKRLADRARQLEDKAEEARRAQKEHQEERRQIEEDVDGEILQIKDKYERKLKQELDTNMRLKVRFSSSSFIDSPLI